MTTTLDVGVRELDHRVNDGIDVRLLWDPRSNRVTVSVNDERFGESFELEVSGADAREAFQHPYVYAGRNQISQTLAA